MSPRHANLTASIFLVCVAIILFASPTRAFASSVVPPCVGVEGSTPPTNPQTDATPASRWLLAGLAVVGLVILAGGAGSLAASVAQLAGMGAAVPGAVWGLALGMTVYLGRVIAAAGETTTSGGATTSTLSSILSFLLGSTGSSSSGDVITALLNDLLSSFLPVALTLSVLGVIGVEATRRLRRRPPGTPSPFGGALGGLLGLGIALGVMGAFPIESSGHQSNYLSGDVTLIDVGSGAVSLMNPSSLPSLVEGFGLGVTPTFTPIYTLPAPEPIPPCATFIGEEAGKLSGIGRDRLVANGVRWAEGAAGQGVEAGLGMHLVVELSPQPDPPGLARWVFRFSSSEGREYAAGIPDRPAPTTSGAGQGFPEGYVASIRGEQFDGATGLWAPVCEDIILLPTSENAPPSSEAPAADPTVMVLQTANCRFGPGVIYSIATSFIPGRILPITGRSEIGAWWQVTYPGTPGRCWLAGNVVEPNGDLSGVPTVFDPPTPTPTEPPPPPQQPGSQGCFFNNVCLHQPCGPQQHGGTPCWY